ncbi:peptidase M48 Ste24p [Halapricum salinum]|uniref:Peptidase M48 Ste24p n=2 Tax=Halapricum salinum TaxID=1457250 RepID=A0A4D6HE89_9EURY|nr:peptidase M48 Ste24p [Halapricum salinum]
MFPTNRRAQDTGALKYSASVLDRMGLESTSKGWRETLATVLLAVVAIGLLGFVFWIFRTGIELVVATGATPLAIGVAGSIAVLGFVLGRSGGLSVGLRITAYLAAIASVSLLFVGFVWLLAVVLVGLTLGVATGFTVANALALGMGGLAAFVLLGAILHGDTAESWALNLRMVAAIVLLSLCSIVFFALVWTAVLLVGMIVFPGDLAAVLATVVATAVIVWAVSRETGQSALEERADARTVSAEEYPELHDRVTRVATQLGVPVPTIALSDRDAPEAMAVGFRPSTAHLVLSTGTLDALDGEQLDAVLAHELAHVKNRDAMVMTLVSTPVVVLDGIRAKLLGNLERSDGTYNGLSETELWGDDEQWRITEPGPIEQRLSNPRVGVLAWLAAAVGGWIAIVTFRDGETDSREGLLVRLVVAVFVLALLVTWLASRAIVAVFSRAREIVADRTAAEVTGSPAALVSALQALDDQIEAAPTRDLRQVSSVSSLSIIPLDRGVLAVTHGQTEAPDLVQRLRQKLFGTHPTTESRIRKLEAMDAEQEAA